MGHIVLKVDMSCGGCATAVTNVLKKMEGVDTVEVDLEKQTVDITGSVTAADAADKVTKSGKATEILQG